MAEAIAVVAAISSVLQVLDFAGKLASHAKELVNSSHDALEDNRQIQELVEDYQRLASTTSREPTDSLDEDERLAVRLSRRCHNESNALLILLQSLKVDSGSCKTKRMWQSAQRAAKAVRKRNEIVKRCKMLEEINGQLTSALLGVVRNDQARQHALLEEVAGLLQKLVDTQKGRDIPVHEEYEYELRLLGRLDFEELPQRLGSISPSYASTYEWIFDDHVTNFGHWLAHGTETYWISGRAGAGKSTLMKFLSTHEKTMQHLRQWSGDQNLIFAHYYFWYLGTPLQKSIEGFLRSVLVQILESDLRLVRVAFPDSSYWSSSRNQKDTSWTEQYLIESIRRLARHEILSTDERSDFGTSRFCFFVDGLDELNGDHGCLIDLLDILESDLHIKLCVASRPWTAFRHAYAGLKPSLRLQDLTRPDVEAYVRGRLGSSQALNKTSSSAAAAVTLFPSHGSATATFHDDITTEIINKAEGCFLWVYLAVASVLRGLSEGDSFAILLKRVRDLPPDLEEFFRTILSRVDGVYTAHTAQVLKLAHLAASRGRYPITMLESFFSYWLISQLPKGIQDIETVYAVPCRRFTLADSDSMISATENFLSSCSRDLLWLETKAKSSLLGPNAGLIERSSLSGNMDSEPQGLCRLGDNEGGNESRPAFAPQVDQKGHYAKRRELALGLSNSVSKSDNANREATRYFSEDTIRQMPPSAWQNAAKVRFLHRTVYDFLCGSDTQSHLDSHLPCHFVNGDLEHILNLAQLKFIATWVPRQEIVSNHLITLEASSGPSWPGQTPDVIRKLVAAVNDGLIQSSTDHASCEYIRRSAMRPSADILECIEAVQAGDPLFFDDPRSKPLWDGPKRFKPARKGRSVSNINTVPLGLAKPQLIKTLLELGGNPDWALPSYSRAVWQNWELEYRWIKRRSYGRVAKGSEEKVPMIAVVMIKAGASLVHGMLECSGCWGEKYESISATFTNLTLVETACPTEHKDEFAKLMDVNRGNRNIKDICVR